MEHLIDIPGRLHSVAVEKHIAGTDQIYDDILKTTLDILNLENITDVKVQEGKLLFLNIQGLVLKEISITTEQKQSDWNLTDSTQVDFIKNKPIIYNKLEVDNKLITKQDIIDDIATIRSGALAGATAYQKPVTGIPATDLASAVQTSLSKADTALQEHQSLAGLVNTGNYNTVSKKIELKHNNTVLAEIDATTFIKDGMVSSVTISNGYLIITFNTDAGKEPISIALTDIFNPANYYDKIAVDNLLANKVDKENGKGLSTNDYTTEDKNKLNTLPTNNALTTILNGKVDTNDLDRYVPKTDDDGHGNMSIYGQGTITMTLADEQGVINQTGTFYAGGWSVSSLDGKFQTSGNTIYRGTIGIDEDSVVWEKTATQQIPVATAEANGLMSAEDKGKLNDLPTATELAQELRGKANSADLAKVATSGSYNDLSDKPTIQELATVKQIYALDATNPDYPSRIGKYAHFDITSVFGTISIVTHYSDGTEEGLSDVRAEGFTEAQYTIDNTTYTSYYKDSKYYYLGIKVPFFIANVEQYGNDYTFGVIKFTSTQSGVFKVHSIGIEPSICTITVNGVVTQSLMSDMVAVQVNEGDVVKVITLRTDNYYVKIIGFVLEGNCGVSVFVNDAGYLTAHQDITGKADKVSNPTEGNFAALNSNGNLIDSGHKHSDYLTQHQSLTNYVQKSQTAGLLKNDGTVDTNLYLIQHQDISGKANKNEMNVVPGTGVDIDKITITLKQGMSATVLTTHQDISGKENAMPIATATGETFTAVVGNYYRLDNVGTLAITLPTIVGATKLQAITFMIACGLSALVTFAPQGSETILYQDGFALEANTIYEVTALWNGSEWTLSRVIYK